MEKLSENAMKILKERYLQEGETPEQMLWRVANFVGSNEIQRDQFFKMMSELKFLPNSPTLMNAGTGVGNLAACFVLPVDDSIDGIFNAIKWAALIHKEGGGTGFSFSNIRPSGAKVKSTGGVASGPVSFMNVFNAATGAIKQGSRRRGANMGVLSVDHPDILEFVDCKTDNSDLTNFNISVAVTDAFMQAVDNDKYARSVWDKIVTNAWKNGEPGIIFIDEMNRHNPTPHIGAIETTNPCGEVPLLSFEACNLGSINLAKFVNKGAIDYTDLKETVYNAIEFLDNIIDKNKYPLPQIEEMVKGNRKIGLGVMGFADMLIQLGVSYNSYEAIKVAEDVMGFIDAISKKASNSLAEKFGAYPNSTDNKYRNATTTTIAPTGTISIIAGTSGGIEPFFSMVYERNIMDGKRMLEIYPKFKDVCSDTATLKQIATDGTLANTKLPDDVKRLFVCAHDVPPEQHVKIQAAFQKFTDNAVSKTVNLPHNATKEDVAKIYKLAYDLKCKGVTIYRDGSRENQVMNRVVATSSIDTPRTRTSMTAGFTEKVKIGCGNLYITVNSDEKGICEVFTNLGKGGGCPSQSEATSRLISISLRAGVDVNSIIEQLKGIRCFSTLRREGMKVLSCPDAIGKALESFHNFNEKMEEIAIAAECPDCGASLTHESGCVICNNCGYSKCG